MNSSSNLESSINLKPWPPAGVKWYYSDDAVAIAHADCREILPTLPPVDLVLTDPPYGINANVKGKESRRAHRLFKGLACKPKDWPDVHGDDEDFDPTHLLQFPEAILFGGNHFCSRLPDSSCWIVWDKRDGGNSDDNADCELAWTNLKGPARLFRHLWRGWMRAGEENIAVSGEKLHPFQKPLALMKFCLSLSRSTGTVCDPYCGSGTTLRAAKDLGRKAIGIEIEERYCEIAAKRMAQEVLQFA